MGLRENRKAKKQQAEEQRAQLDAALAKITLSTISTVPKPCVEVGVYWGDPGNDIPDALRNLKLKALEGDCDAVLGVGLCSHAHGHINGGTGPFSGGTIHNSYVAYGTAVRWTTTPQQT